jgi:hypothetical protein
MHTRRIDTMIRLAVFFYQVCIAFLLLTLLLLSALAEAKESRQVRRASELGEDCYIQCCGSCRVRAFCALKNSLLGVASTACVLTTPSQIGDYCCIGPENRLVVASLGVGEVGNEDRAYAGLSTLNYVTTVAANSFASTTNTSPFSRSAQSTRWMPALAPLTQGPSVLPSTSPLSTALSADNAYPAGGQERSYQTIATGRTSLVDERPYATLVTPRTSSSSHELPYVTLVTPKMSL